MTVRDMVMKGALRSVAVRGCVLLALVTGVDGAPQTSVADPLQPLAFPIGGWEGTSGDSGVVAK